METHSGPRAEGKPRGDPDACLGSSTHAQGSPAALGAAGHADCYPLLVATSITCPSLNSQIQGDSFSHRYPGATEGSRM